MMTAQTGLEGLHPDFIDPVESPSVFTTLRWDKTLLESSENTAASCKSPSPVYLFEHHWTRLQVAKWGTSWYSENDVPAKSRSPAYMLHAINTAVSQWQRGRPTCEAIRLKFRCYVGGKMSVEIAPIERIPIHRLFPKSLAGERAEFGIAFSVVLDTQSTEPTEVTMYKTSQRECYTRARHEAGIASLSDAREVLLYGENGTIFDASISTPYFYRHGKWVTPTSSSGGQQGVTRRWALENHLAVECDVRVDELVDGESIWLSNAVKGYFPGIFYKRSTRTSEVESNGV